MKKTVSINIGGIIFHIEDDGFEKLKSYLDSVNKYFSTFEDSKEIIADIEGRIAEIFLSKLNASRQTINLDDVNDLITTMGTTQDFDATLEAEPEPPKSEEKEEQKKSTGKKEKTRTTAKRLYRDTKRRIIGGVSAGIAHYFGIDPLWIRLLFIALFVNVFFTGISGATVLAYIVLWIVLPYNSDLEEDTRIKKLFRNPEARVLGGVSGGIAAYFGIDVSVVRLLFVISIFLGGAGILIYIILWIITPEAKTITEKVQMEGEPVTLKTIEESVRRNLRVKEGEEGPFVKILLFPFRLIAIVIDGLARALGPLMKFLVDAVRIIFGVILALDGFIWMIILTALLLTLYGVGGLSSLYQLGEIPLDLVKNSLDSLVVFSIWIFGIITSFAIFLIGLSLILKRKIVKSYIGWSLFALWVLSAILISFSLPGYITEFRSNSNYRVEQEFEQSAEVPLLKLSEESRYDIDLVDLRLRGHKDSVFRLVVDIESRGATRNQAVENAKQVIYEVKKEGNTFLFDPKITFPEGSKFRFQQVNATLYIPEGQVFRMERELNNILENTLSSGGYRSSQMENNDWVFNEDGLACITCQTDQSAPGGSNRDGNDDEMTYPFEDFDEVKVASFMEIEIRQGSEYNVTVRGDDDDLDEVYLNQVGDELEIRFKEDNWEWWSDKNDRETKLFITMPELEYLELVGKCKGNVSGFDEDEMEIQLVGASDLFLESNVERMDISIAGASEMVLKGSGDDLSVEIVGASKLEGFDFKVRNASLEVVGASSAEVYVTENLSVEAAGMSKVRYRGDARVSSDEAGLSTVERD